MQCSCPDEIAAFFLDGGVVVEGSGGAPDFSALQDALSTGRTDQLIFYAFDLLYLDGYDLRRAPLIERKAALAEIIGAPGIVRYSEHFEEDGPRLLGHACRLGLEGVVSKVRDAPYRSGRARSGSNPNASIARNLLSPDMRRRRCPARQSAPWCSVILTTES
jgi:bifunctional non-homologous end joining protein LigD